ncbi:MAG: type I-B CRISPR-associated endonuclease Cas1b [Cytophagaceae bacterium]|jgi:CRISPR-associated protein Cas1|nr:type I-B CRISPR-associated endonuclease Cas1b [Cytophagaceae bacterium]
MKRTYYLFNPGRLSRKDNTLRFDPVDEVGNGLPAKYIPVETVDNLYVFGSLDANSALYNFLGKNHVAVHFFDYYEHYTGSFMPKEYLLAGRMLVKQVEHFSKPSKRLTLAKSFVYGSSNNILRNLNYYCNREKDVSRFIQLVELYQGGIDAAQSIPELMGIEGNIRMSYYEAFDVIINDFVMDGRSKQPPRNEINAMISFVNSLTYTACLDAIYHTQLNPTISFLHEPGERRYSLALDLSEIFKPILADRLIFSLLNKKQIQSNHFDFNVNYCVLKETGRRKVVESWEERLRETIKHRGLGRNVSYKHLIRLECYKLSKHILGIEEYKPFKSWW